MTDRPTPLDDVPADPLADAGAWGLGVMRGQIGVLEQLSQAGLRLALAIEAQAAKPAPDRPAEAPPAFAEASADQAQADLPAEALAQPEMLAMAFSRVARAVRLTALLQARLLRDFETACGRVARDQRCAAGRVNAQTQAAQAAAQAQAQVLAQAQAQAAADAARRDPAFDHKGRVESIVARVARAEGEDEERIEGLVREAGERLDDEDIYGDVLTRPIGELVALICRDLGLHPDWSRLAEEAWAQKEMASGARGSPFVPCERPPRRRFAPPDFTADPADAHPSGVPPASERRYESSLFP